MKKNETDMIDIYTDDLFSYSQETEIEEMNEDEEPKNEMEQKEIQFIKTLEEVDADKDASTFVKKSSNSKNYADEIVKAFFNNRTDENWTRIQEYFWFGIKQFAYDHFMKNWDDAYDMTIETFINAYSKIDSYDPEKAKFSTWLWTICKNNCIGKLKHEAKIPKVNNDISDIYDSELLENSFSNDFEETNYIVTNDGGLEEVSKSEINSALYKISMEEIERLDDLDGKIIKMKLFDNKKIFEIADELKMNESTVKNHLYKSKRNLARILQIKHKTLYKLYVEANS